MAPGNCAHALAAAVAHVGDAGHEPPLLLPLVPLLLLGAPLLLLLVPPPVEIGPLVHALSVLAAKQMGALGAKQHDAVIPLGPSVHPVMVAPG